MIGVVYKSLWPKAFKDMTYTDILPDDVTPRAYPFVALMINTGSPDDPVVSEPHRDVLDAFYGVACLYAFGDYKDGNLILWELQKVIELNAGDAFLFPAHLITHSNTEVIDERHSLVAYTREEILKYYIRHGDDRPQGGAQIQTRIAVQKN